MIKHGGADVASPVSNIPNLTIFSLACRTMSPAFVEELAGLVPADHLVLEDGRYISPMCAALECNQFRIPITKMLILRGAPVPVQEEFTRAAPPDVGRIAIRNELLAWIEGELAVQRTFLGLVLGCGVHGARAEPPAPQSQLLKLRGDGNTDARMRIAAALGVRVKAELGRLRRAAVGLLAQS